MLEQNRVDCLVVTSWPPMQVYCTHSFLSSTCTSIVILFSTTNIIVVKDKLCHIFLLKVIFARTVKLIFGTFQGSLFDKYLANGSYLLIS